jgi:hypothetical protein
MDDAKLRTIWQQLRSKYRPISLSEPLSAIMKQHAKRVRRLGDISLAWNEVVPADMLEHTTLEGLHAGVLTVAVDSASRRFQLQTFLSGGGLQQIRERCRTALNRIRLVPGPAGSGDTAE